MLKRSLQTLLYGTLLSGLLGCVTNDTGLFTFVAKKTDGATTSTTVVTTNTSSEQSQTTVTVDEPPPSPTSTPTKVLDTTGTFNFIDPQHGTFIGNSWVEIRWERVKREDKEKGVITAYTLSTPFTDTAKYTHQDIIANGTPFGLPYDSSGVYGRDVPPLMKTYFTVTEVYKDKVYHPAQPPIMVDGRMLPSVTYKLAEELPPARAYYYGQMADGVTLEVENKSLQDLQIVRSSIQFDKVNDFGQSIHLLSKLSGLLTRTVQDQTFSRVQTEMSLPQKTKDQISYGITTKEVDAPPHVYTPRITDFTVFNPSSESYSTYYLGNKDVVGNPILFMKNQYFWALNNVKIAPIASPGKDQMILSWDTIPSEVRSGMPLEVLLAGSFTGPISDFVILDEQKQEVAKGTNACDGQLLRHGSNPENCETIVFHGLQSVVAGDSSKRYYLYADTSQAKLRTTTGNVTLSARMKGVDQVIYDKYTFEQAFELMQGFYGYAALQGPTITM